MKRGYHNILLEDRPVGCWPLHDANGTAAQNLIGTAGTYTPASDGAWTGGTLGALGPISGEDSRGATFGGTGYVSTPGLGLAGLSSWSFGLWLRLSGTSDAVTVLSEGRTSTFSEYLQIYVSSSSDDLRMGIVSGGASQLIASGVGLRDGRWHHVVAQRDASLWRLFVDGSQAVSATATTTPPSLDLLTIGATGRRTTYQEFFIGSLAWVAAYNYALPAHRVQAHYLIGKNGVYGPGRIAA